VSWNYCREEGRIEQKNGVRLHAGTKIFVEVVNYPKEVTKEVGMDTKFEIEGDELVVVT